MDLIQSIRKGYGLDLDITDPQARAAIQNLTENLQQASQRLSEDLYSKATHFVLEFIQNADDNKYYANVTPTLVMRLSTEDRRMEIQCNETGFGEGNVRAICSIGASTKTSQAGYIGEKGIGFKSVFAVADTVRICSREYTFMFDKGKPLGMIAPIWMNNAAARSGWTTFELGLSPKIDGDELVSRLKDIRPSLILFLQKIHRMEITTDNKNLTIKKTVLKNGVTRIQRSGDGPAQSNDYIIFKHAVTTAKGEEKREGVSSSEIVLSFPVTQYGHPVISDQNVHAFLPLRPFGFTFVIQADFLTASNREDILADREWNRVLRDAIPAAFLEAVPDLQRRPNLLFTWLRYVPHRIVNSFFSPVHASLVSRLKQSRIIMCQDGILRRPSDVLILPPKYRESKKDTPLIPSEHIIPKYYLSDKYDISVDGAILETLGVVSMSEDHFLHGLSLMERNGTLSTQTDTWWEKVCSVLSEMVRLPVHRYAISRLKIVPLADETWSAVSGDIYFDSALADIPQDVDLRLVKHLDPTSFRFWLLRSLGLREANADIITEKIEYLHMHGSLQFHRETLPYHAQFLFKNRLAGTLRDSYSLKVITRDNQILPAAQVYMDDPKHASLPLSSCLALPDAHFLHANYDSLPWATPDSHLQDWRDWLHQRLKIAIAPRILSSGLSPELRTFLKSADTSQILAFFKEYGTDLVARTQQVPAARKELRELIVVTSTGARRPLESTYLARRSLSRFADLPFLPLKDPDAHHWDFLSALGVSFQVDGAFYLKQLINLSEEPLVAPAISPDTTLEKAEQYYKQLEARFDDDDYAIRDAFSQKNLIYAPARRRSSSLQQGRWLSLQDVVWNGPSSMRLKYALTTAYSGLGTFFRERLNVPPCPTDILLQELQSISQSHAGTSIDDAVHMRIHDILSDLRTYLNVVLASSPVEVPPWLPKLRNVSFVPVKNLSDQVVLKRMDEEYYVPDASGHLAELFRGAVPMLSLPPPKDSGGNLLLVRSLLKNLQRLLAQKAPDIRFNFLESVVKKELAGAVSERSPNVTLSERYQSRAQYINRLVTDVTLAKSLEPILPKLQDIGVYEVDSEEVDHSYTLGDIIRMMSHPIGVEITDSRCVILIGKACKEDKREVLLCRELAWLFPGIPAKDLLFIFTMSPSMIEMFLSLNSVSSDLLEDSDLSTEDWFHTLDNSTKQVPSRVPALGLSPSRRSSLRPSLTIEQELKTRLSLDIPQLRDAAAQQTLSSEIVFIEASLQKLTITGVPRFNNTSVKSSENTFTSVKSYENIFTSVKSYENTFTLTRTSQTVPPDAVFTQDVSDIERPALFGPTDILEILPSSISYQAKPQGIVEQEYTGIRGEIFAYWFLEKQLPEFTFNNWTSELRIHNGFPAFTGGSIADFTYDDNTGKLTGMLFGPERKQRWNGEWPTYHLEVKSSSGPASTPFHINSRQVHYAQQMTLCGDERPQHVYVLVRVSSLPKGGQFGSPSVKMYPDPWRILYRGGLVIASDVEMAIVA